MDIREIDVDADSEFGPYYAIMRAADLAEHDQPFWTQHEAAVTMRGDDSEEWTVLAAFEGEEMVGAAFLVFPLLDNVDKTWGAIFVAPERSRRGIGSALAEHLQTLCTSRGRTVIITESTLAFDRREDHPNRRFAEKHGFALASVEVTRVLRLPVSPDVIEGWTHQASPHHQDYRIETHVDTMADELIPSLVDVLNQLILDAPTGDIEFEEEKSTPEIWRQRRAKLLEQGRHTIVTVALDGDNRVVAMTQLVVPPEDRPKVYQWATVVHREHRGHRLGLAVKAQNLRRLQELFPDRTEVWTTNEEANGPMLDINVAMGFEPLNVLCHFQWKSAG